MKSTRTVVWTVKHRVYLIDEKKKIEISQNGAYLSTSYENGDSKALEGLE